MLQYTITVNEVREVQGFLPMSHRSSGRYSSNRMVKNTYHAKSLLVRATTDSGQKVSFFTPSAVVLRGSGMLNYEVLQTKTTWFKQVKKEMVGHKNPMHYKGSTEMSVCIEDKSEIVPTIQVGDTVRISANIKGETRFGVALNRVKLTSNP